MIDHQLHDILSKLDNVEKKGKTPLTESKDLTKDNAVHDSNQDTMRDFLSIINEDVSPAGPKKTAMPGTHVMAKGSKDGQHPAHEFLVGGDEGEVPELADEQLDEVDMDESVFTPKPEGGKKPHMKGTHKMKKDTKRMNSSNKFLVGGEEGEVPELADEQLDEAPDTDRYHALMRDLEEWLAMFGDEPNDAYYAIADIIGDYGGDNSGVDYPDDMMGVSDDDARKEYFDDPMNKRHYESVDPDKAAADYHRSEQLDREYDKAKLNWDDDYDEDSTIAGKWRKGGPKDDSQYEDVHEVYDNESMSFKTVKEADIEEDKIADKSTSRKTGLQKDKGSFKDVFKSMEERSENLGKELYSELSAPELTTDEGTGKSRLNDDAQFDNESELRAEIKHMAGLLHGGIGRDAHSEVVSKLNGLKQQLKQFTQKETPSAPDPRRPYQSDHDMTGRTHSLYDSIEKKHKGLK